MEMTEEGTPRELGLRGQDPLLGQRLLHFRVLEEIGQGGMSVVYRGRDEQLGRDVAIKVLHPFLAQKSECRQRLAREARAVARLEHENILRIFAYSGDPPTVDEKPAAGEPDPEGLERAEDSQEGFLVVEYVPGDTLKQWAVGAKVWEMPEIGALITCALARALAHAHAQGVIHRDLKPENVMIRDDGVVKLMDFGIAQVADSKSLTVTGTLLGSPAHMAPESIEGYPADERSDLFSLGTVLYWLTTGALPFEALTPHALLKAIVDGRRNPPQQRQPRISDELAKIIEKAMATRPGDRYESAEAMADALDGYLADVGFANEDIATVLAAPNVAKERLSQVVRTRFLDKAEHLLDEGHAAKALGALSRVLAEFPQDEAATALLEKAHSNVYDDDDEEEEAAAEGMDVPQEAEDVDTQESLPAHLRRAKESAGLVGSPTGAPRPDRGRTDPVSPRVLFRRAALLAAVVAVISLAVVVANAMDKSRPVASEPAVAPPRENVRLTIDAESGAATATNLAKDGTAATKKRPLSTPLRADIVAKLKGSKDLGRTRLRPGKLPIRRPLAKEAGGRANETANDDGSAGAQPGGAVAAANGTDRGVAAATDVKRKIEIRVVPWADIFVDDIRVAENAKAATVDLAPGRHVVRFSNIKAIEAVREIDVPATGHVPQVRVRLKPKPAQLVVKTNVDADVLLQSVSGSGRRFVGSAAASQDTPILISFDHRAERRFEVVLHKSGYKTVVRQVTFGAGETTEVNAVLEPDADGATTTGRQPIQPER